MFKPVELFIGLRYTRAKRRNHFISFISLTSMLGIALGVTALITVLSVMNGFEKEVRERILDMVAHLTVTNFEGRVRNWRKVAEHLESQQHVLAVAPYIKGEGMLIHRKQVNGVITQGVDPEYEPGVSRVAERMDVGKLSDLKPGKFRIILGFDLARSLGLDVGDKVTLVTPTANVTPAGISPRLKRFTVAGIFRVGHNIYDTSMALMHVEDAALLYRMKGYVSGVRAQLDDPFISPLVRTELAKDEFFSNFWVRDWSRTQANWFRAVKVEKRMIFLLLLLIVAVAAFNIVSTLVMVVTDKQSDIAILRTLGATPGSVMGMFMVQGTLIGIVGTVLGLAGGVSLALNLDTVVPFLERLFGFQVLDPGIYYISELPSDLHWNDVWTICTVSFLLGLLSTLYPAWRAARTQPAEALRYE